MLTDGDGLVANIRPNCRVRAQDTAKYYSTLSFPSFPFHSLVLYSCLPLLFPTTLIPQLRQTACVSLHACAGFTSSSTRFPRSKQPTARRESLPPNLLPLARSTHDKTPQRPIALANTYTTLVIPRDVPAITTGGLIAREPAFGLAAGAQCCPAVRLRASLCWQPQRSCFVRRRRACSSKPI